MGHTPAPWIASPPLGSSRRVFVPDDTIEIRAGERGGVIAALYRQNWAGDQDAANARLIAAAPALLEALQAFIEHEGIIESPVGSVDALFIKARAAIALATGDKS